MAYLPKRFYHDTPGTTATTLVTAATGGGGVIIKQILLANSGTTAKTVTIALDPGGAAGLIASGAGANVIVPGISVQAKTLITLDLSVVMSPTDVLRGLQETANYITVSVSGVTF